MWKSEGRGNRCQPLEDEVMRQGDGSREEIKNSDKAINKGGRGWRGVAQLCGHRSVGDFPRQRGRTSLPPLHPFPLPSLLPSPLFSPNFLSSSKAPLSWLPVWTLFRCSVLVPGYGRASSSLQALGCYSLVSLSALRVPGDG